MKKELLYIVAWCVALLPVACDKEDSDAVRYGFGEGGIVMSVAPSTRAINDAELTLANCTVDIYQRTAEDASDEPTWIRHYAPGKCPETVKLLAGDYSVSVEWGERPADAAPDKCFYKGSADFTVTAGATQPVVVVCKPQCAVVAVGFDASIADKELSDVRVEVSLPTSAAAKKSLLFTSSDTGYFTMPEAGAELAWSFHAVHPEKGDVDKTGTVKNVVNGKKYALNFRYSDDLPGYIGLELEIDNKTDNYNDLLVFSPAPVVEGSIFDAVQDFADTEMALAMKTVGEATVREAKIYQVGAAAATRAAADSDLLLWHWQCPASAGAEPTVTDKTNVTATLSDDWKSLDVTLNPAFFTFPVGETKLRFEIIDSKDALAEKTAVIRVNEGILSEVDACDLWANSVTLRAVSTKGAPTFKLRLQGTDTWKTVAGVSAGGNQYTAAFTSDDSDWTASDNAQAGVPVYRPRKEHSVYANNTYEIAAEINGHEYRTTFRPVCNQPIPNGDMADASCSCFSTSNENTVFWGSGNNSFASALCVRDTKSGLYCAHLKSVMAGALGINMLASGNLFSGTFVRPSTTGTVSFGQDYDWKARPTALHLKYHATIGTVNQQKHKKTDGSHPANIGEQDEAILYVAIVDWAGRHEVKSGTSAPSGMWLPDEAVSQPEGPVIGYGIFIIDKSTEGSELVDYEIPIYYYDKVTKPSGNYKIVISSATNIYGDYMCGCDSNELWLTDFSWVY
ncbi:MAG: DUF4493 domain-containing protein [Alistipes senegalensis]|nr:DUF4493 domain-containing protein [Bacteroides cellulosilyticus]MCM1351152.1 DUF4493 domain-containing protein [Alistipes senegalensis]